LWCQQPAKLCRHLVHGKPFAWATSATVRQHNTPKRQYCTYIKNANFVYSKVNVEYFNLRGDSDKSLVRSTSRCRRAESIMSLERGVCSRAELQVVSCYIGWKEACQTTRGISKDRDARCQFFSPLQGKAPKEIDAILTEKLGENTPSYANVKYWVTQFKRSDFSTCDAPRPGRHKTVSTTELIDQIQ
jgi:hypothetical protein